jgi:hypothetical protein
MAKILEIGFLMRSPDGGVAGFVTHEAHFS